ncbi:MFS transporter [Thioalkalivibrio sp. ALE31]|uniref:MFS transporter n=1 Tax=Thioalkalivibrio sp. ALE31 TaxID=1158182 RepID=UPI000368CCEA|nr:MFS transporter [Thioalkalivibrio sp. ALE31]
MTVNDLDKLPRPIIGLYETIAGDEDARVCKDIPENACRAQPVNFFVHLVANTLSKIGDELASARLVLAWLLGALGAPAAFAGFLVPIRESGSLLPQLFVAASIRRRAIRKGFWVLGSVLSGLAVAGMAVVALTLEGAAAGWAILGLLIVFALSRGINSVASKDVLGKTIAKHQRGTVMGYAASLAGFFTLGLGIYLTLANLEEAGIGVFVALLAASAGAWWVAAATFTRLREDPGSTEGGGNAVTEAIRSMRLLWTDRAFGHFVLTRALLMSTALALPFYVLLAEDATAGDLGTLGLLILASGLASAVSAPVWGRLSDRSARWVLILSGLLAAGLGIAVAVGVWFVPVDTDHALVPGGWLYAALFFLLGVSHAGVRLGRKTYLVDMATQETRAAFTAVSNTVIGALLLVGGLFGLLAQLAGTEVAIFVLALMSLAGAASAWLMGEA